MIRFDVADVLEMGRAIQVVLLKNLERKNVKIASVCKVMSSELEATVEEESRAQWDNKTEEIKKDSLSETNSDAEDEPLVDFEDDDNEE